MRAVSVGPCLTMSRLVLVPAIAVLLATPLSNAQAQFGKLKKMGADAIKDKAKEKVAGKEAPEATATTSGTATGGSKTVAADSKPVSMTLNASQLDLMLAALTPMAADAEQATQIRKLAAAHIQKNKAAEKCLNDAVTGTSTGRKVGRSPSAVEQARSGQLEKDIERLSEVFAASLGNGNRRVTAFSQDSMTTKQMQNTVLQMGLSCTFEFTPAAVMETQVATWGMSGDLPDAPSSVPEQVRKTFSKYDFALLRERIALFALSSADPTAKVGKQGVFSDEEKAALAARMPQIQKLQPFFKNGTLSWKGTSDLITW